ncbi:hypothetical protein [Pseudomonas gregormendelii]
MTIYATMNPLGSTHPKDLRDNSQNLDYWSIGPLYSYPDRLGVNRLSRAGIEASFAAAQANKQAVFDASQANKQAVFDASQNLREEVFGDFLEGSGYSELGDYAAGISIVSHSQTVEYGGQPYALKASVPSSISAPYVTTGNWATESVNFKLVGDDSLRQQLALPPGSRMLRHQRAPAVDTIDDVGGMLDAQPVSPREYAHLVTVKPTPSDSSTWDWKPALLAAAAAGPVVDRSLRFYRTSPVVFPSTAHIELNIRPFDSIGRVVTIEGDASYIQLNIDAEGKGVTAVYIPANRVTGRAFVNNITGQPVGVGGNQAGVNITGTGCEITVVGRNHLKGTSDNDSVPRLVAVDGSGGDNIVRVIGRSINCGLVNNHALLSVPDININGATDNAIYNLAGVMDVDHGVFIGCMDEIVVGGGKVNFGSKSVIDCNGSSGVSDCQITIGKYSIISDDPARAFVPFRSRPGNTSSSVTISELTGTLNLTAAANGGGIFQFEAGTIAVSVGRIDLKLRYKTGSTKALVKHATGSFTYGNVKMELIDDTATLTGSDKFDFTLPAAVAAPSYLGDCQLISASGDVRVSNSIQASVRIANGVEVTTTSGPYVAMENASFPKPRRVVGSGVPVGPGWVRGDSIVVKNISDGGAGAYRSLTTGSGSWRATEWLVKRGTTGARPALTASEPGIMYFDTTLTPNGKPIFWTGTLWVDATGASV